MPIKKLPILPIDLDDLSIVNLPLDSMPPLPNQLRYLTSYDILFRESYTVPNHIRYLNIDNTFKISNPNEIEYIFIHRLESEGPIKKLDNEDIMSYIERCATSFSDPLYPAVEHCRVFKAELLKRTI
jgi:hypothetical protein